MNIRPVPKSLSNIQALDPLKLPDPPPETVTDLASKHVSLNAKESFTELSHPTALDKMLLPASPQLKTSEGTEIPPFMASNTKKELKIAEDEQMKQAIDLHILTKQKI